MNSDQIKISFNVVTNIVREASVILYDTSVIPGREVFSIELDGSIKGSLNEALSVCEEMLLLLPYYDQTLTKVMIGVLRALKRLGVD